MVLPLFNIFSCKVLNGFAPQIIEVAPKTFIKINANLKVNISNEVVNTYKYLVDCKKLINFELGCGLEWFIARWIRPIFLFKTVPNIFRCFRIHSEIESREALDRSAQRLIFTESLGNSTA